MQRYAVAMVASFRTDALDPSTETSQHISGVVDQEVLDPVNTTVDIMVSIIIGARVGVLPQSVMLFREDKLVANWVVDRDFTPDALTQRLGEKVKEICEQKGIDPSEALRSIPRKPDGTLN